MENKIYTWKTFTNL